MLSVVTLILFLYFSIRIRGVQRVLEMEEAELNRIPDQNSNDSDGALK